MKYILTLLVMASLVACQTEEEQWTNTDIENENWIFRSFENDEDQAEENMNLSKLKVAEILRGQLLKDPSQISSFVSNFTTENSFHKANEVFETLLGSKHSVQNTEIDALVSEITSSMVYRSIQYYPIVSLMNEDLPNTRLNKSGTVILAVGHSVTENDEIPGWLISNGNYTEILVSENDLKEDVPVFIVQNGTDHIEYSEASDSKWEGNGTGELNRTTGPISLQFTQRQIKDGYRYETGNRKTKVHYEFTLYKSSFPYYDLDWKEYLWFEGVGESRDNKLIQKISKSSVNSSTSFTGSPWQSLVWHHPAIIYDEGDAKYYVTVYEDDWYSSRKSVQSCMYGIAALTHKVRMEYSHNWYYQDYCDFSAKDSWPWASFSVENDKCSFTITRTN